MLKYLSLLLIAMCCIAFTGNVAKAEDPAIARIVSILEGMDKRLDNHEARLNSHESRLTQVEGRLGALESKYGGGFSPYGPCQIATPMQIGQRRYVPVRIILDD